MSEPIVRFMIRYLMIPIGIPSEDSPPNADSSLMNLCFLPILVLSLLGSASAPQAAPLTAGQAASQDGLESSRVLASQK